jgi:phosphoribosylglycinamide formyltransferase 2
MTENQIKEAQIISARITESLGGFGLFGVELFLLKDGRVLFSEVSPRPHDTGMVTLTTQAWSEFALHARAILQIPIAQVTLLSAGASVALKSPQIFAHPKYRGIENALALPNVDVRIFGKPNATEGRRMGVVLASADTPTEALKNALNAANKIKIVE